MRANMIRRCAWCGKDMGEKEPLDDQRVTHGICQECLKKELREDSLSGNWFAKGTKFVKPEE